MNHTSDQLHLKIGNCPECDGKIEIQERVVGALTGLKELDIVDCDECGAELKIMSLEPLKFEVVLQEYDRYDDVRDNLDTEIY